MVILRFILYLYVIGVILTFIHLALFNEEQRIIEHEEISLLWSLIFPVFWYKLYKINKEE